MLDSTPLASFARSCTILVGTGELILPADTTPSDAAGTCLDDKAGCTPKVVVCLAHEPSLVIWHEAGAPAGDVFELVFRSSKSRNS